MRKSALIQGVNTAKIVKTTNSTFVSIGYDYVRIGKEFSEADVEYLKSKCILTQNEKGEWMYYFQQNRRIRFTIYGTLVFLCICPPKLLRFENVRLATPDEMEKALNKVERETKGFSFWNGYVAELHFTWTLLTPEPFANYRSLLRTPYLYRHEKQEHGDYYNSNRITILFYDKAIECKGVYSPSLQSEFGTFTPELFRAEIRLEKEVRKVLVESKCWDTKKTRFLAKDLVSDETFRNLTLYANKYILRFLKPMEKTTPKKIISDNSFVRVSCATENGYLAITELHKKGLYSDEMFRRATKYYNEAKEQERNEYLRKHLSEKVASVLAEYEPERSIDAIAKRALDRISRSKIVSLPPEQVYR